MQMPTTLWIEHHRWDNKITCGNEGQGTPAPARAHALFNTVFVADGPQVHSLNLDWIGFVCVCVCWGGIWIQHFPSLRRWSTVYTWMHTDMQIHTEVIAKPARTDARLKNWNDADKKEF